MRGARLAAAAAGGGLVGGGGSRGGSGCGTMRAARPSQPLLASATEEGRGGGWTR